MLLTNIKTKPKPDSYAKKKKYDEVLGLAISASGREIGSIPKCRYPKIKARCAVDLKYFCQLLFPQTFTLPFSEDHNFVIRQFETSIREGGIAATAMPRGSGKSSIATCACIWALVNGWRDFIALICSNESHASSLLQGIGSELNSNDRLLAVYPEVCFPIRALENISHRCRGQLCEGKPTRINITADVLVLPTIPGSKASGAVIKVAGLTANFRGMVHLKTTGEKIRPSLVVVDEPGNDRSAVSPSQNEKMLRLITGAVLNLAGPSTKISGLLLMTVICKDDVADRLLSREQHPEFQGTRCKLVYQWPTTDQTLWRQYGEIRAESLRNGNAGREATEFYAANRAAMDDGAVTQWSSRFNSVDEISSLQHAYNLRLRDERAFFSEMQNDPMPEIEIRSDDLTALEIMAKINRRPRGTVGTDCDHVVAAIDIQQNILVWTVCAFEPGFTGYVIDYGAFPDPGRAYWSLKDVGDLLGRAVPNAGIEGRLYSGLEMLTNALCERNYPRDDGNFLRCERILIDANWPVSTRSVYLLCKQSLHASSLTPFHGKFIGASSSPMSEWSRKQGQRTGLNWILRAMNAGKGRGLVADVNFWKTYLMSRLRTSMGDRGCLSLFGDKSETHRMYADNLTAEYSVITEGRGRKCTEFKQRPGQDNHLLDTTTMCLIAASMQGVVLETSKPVEKKKKLGGFAAMRARQART